MTVRDLLIWIAGVAFGIIFVIFIVTLDRIDKLLLSRRHEPPRPGYIDFTWSTTTSEGRDASANSDDVGEPSGAGTSPRPHHLRSIKGGKSGDA